MYTIGSGSVKFLLAKNKHTKSYHTFLKAFFGIEEVYYNAYNSPIQHLKIGQMTEDTYIRSMSDEWYTQVRACNPNCEVLVSHLDCARLDSGAVEAAKEIKSIKYDSYITLNEDTNIKKSYRPIYNQIQQQLYTSKLEYITLVFICVYDYDEISALTREIQENEKIEYTIYRDEDVIQKIVECATPFNELRKGANL